MNDEFFTNLPSEIIIDILSRLPVRNVLLSKCVCTSWLDLIQTPEFAKSHLSKSVPGLVVNQCETYELPDSVLKLFDFEEAIEEHQPHEYRYNPITEIRFLMDPQPCILIEGSANGLLFFRLYNAQSDDLYIFNPIMRDYIQLPSPERIVRNDHAVDIYGFGVSKISDQYKVVRIVVQPDPKCEVYTLGTRTWRSVACGVLFKQNCRSICTLHNGKLHWLIPDLKDCLTVISSFDLETETFSTFSPSPPRLSEGKSFVGHPQVFGGCLCLCDTTSDDEIVIWMMKNEQWRKGFKISRYPDLVGLSYDCTYPVMIFGDGDVLMRWGELYLFYYSGKTRTTKGLATFDVDLGRVEAMLHTSSFVSLKSFVMENVSSF